MVLPLIHKPLREKELTHTSCYFYLLLLLLLLWDFLFPLPTYSLLCLLRMILPSRLLLSLFYLLVRDKRKKILCVFLYLLLDLLVLLFLWFVFLSLFSLFLFTYCAFSLSTASSFFSMVLCMRRSSKASLYSNPILFILVMANGVVCIFCLFCPFVSLC